MDDPARAMSALHALDPGCAREQWVRIGMAAKDAGLSLDDFTTWSGNAGNYSGERDCAQVWRSFTDGPVKAATLYGLAFDAGWKDPAKRHHNGQSPRQPVTTTAAPIRPQQTPQRADKSVSGLWARCAAATGEHPYILAKRGQPDGLRIVGAGATATAPSSWALPSAIDAAEWKHARPTPDTLVRDYLYADVATLIAPGATGKTTLLLYEAICIVLGLLLYGLEILRRGPVLILTAEDSREMLVARLRSIAVEMELTPEQISVVRDQVRISDVSGTGFKLTMVRGEVVVPTETVDQVIAECRDFNPVLIVIDPTVSFGIGESRVNDAEQGLIEAARRLLRALNCCVRYVHHTGKQNARDRSTDQYSGRGGSALPDGARMVAVMQLMTADEWLQATGSELLDGDTGLRLARPKLSYAPPAGDIYIRRTGYRFQHVPPSSNGPATLRDANANQVWQLLDSELKQGRYHSRNSLESLDHGIKRADLRKAIDWLVASGRIESRDRPNNNQGGAYKYFHPIASPSNAGEPNQKQVICLASETMVFASPPYTENNGGEAPPLVLSASVGSPEKHGEASANHGESLSTEDF